MARHLPRLEFARGIARHDGVCFSIEALPPPWGMRVDLYVSRRPGRPARIVFLCARFARHLSRADPEGIQIVAGDRRGQPPPRY